MEEAARTRDWQRKWDEPHHADQESSKAETLDRDRSALPLSYRFHSISFDYSESGTDNNFSGMNLSEAGTNERWKHSQHRSTG